jgi:hypothetical protein
VSVVNPTVLDPQNWADSIQDHHKTFGATAVIRLKGQTMQLH